VNVAQVAKNERSYLTGLCGSSERQKCCH